VKRLHLGANVARTHMRPTGMAFPWHASRSGRRSCAQARAPGSFFDAGIVPDAAVEPLWLELVSCPATTFVVVNRFDCATAHPFNGAERRRRRMASAIAGTFIILSIGILMAHAMDAFRSGS
jgi:hypothetical protein